ncbi:MAG: Fur family transcriptional regulator [Candidatus Limnocylindrales bacterium]
MSNHTATLERSVEAAGYRSTASRRSLLGLIEGRRSHFTAADLEADVRRRRLSVGRATIFRTLDLLVELGAVERLDLPSGDHAYVVCDPNHHHHVVCSGCGRTRDIDDHGLRAVVAEVARHTGYRIDDHRLEMFGRCPECLARGTD